MYYSNNDITPILTRCCCGCIVLNMKRHLLSRKHEILLEESNKKQIAVEKRIQLMIPLKLSYEIKPYINFNDDDE